MANEPLVRQLRRARRWVAHRLWNLAGRIWVEPDDDRTAWAYWEMSATFQGTDAEADRILMALSDLGSSALGLHESDTRYIVGGMTRHEIEGDETMQETT